MLKRLKGFDNVLGQFQAARLFKVKGDGSPCVLRALPMSEQPSEHIRRIRLGEHLMILNDEGIGDIVDVF